MYMKLLVIVLFLCHLTCLNYAEENAEAANLEQVFKDMDTNGNNKVTKKEVSKYLQTKGLGMEPDSDDFKRIVQSFFDSYDKNKDKAITVDEFAPKKDEL
ncbi:Hypothetical predicted protein [Mytilus galloprovincialis]|uniref:peptidylprolyl isomerase n=3 Tax=Mytilus galloprovincialis TaxID=29158 RepID=A0A8B6EQI9_MYTGA|nr:Hypothetical predicted protein [Mytilus galloprovincialis]